MPIGTSYINFFNPEMYIPASTYNENCNTNILDPSLNFFFGGGGLGQEKNL